MFIAPSIPKLTNEELEDAIIKASIEIVDMAKTPERKVLVTYHKRLVREMNKRVKAGEMEI